LLWVRATQKEESTAERVFAAVYQNYRKLIKRTSLLAFTNGLGVGIFTNPGQVPFKVCTC